MKIAVTGARGLLGSEVLRCLAAVGHAVIGWSRGSYSGYRQVDVRYRDGIDRVLDLDRPDVVIHCAAEPSIESCEADPAAARIVNALAVRRLVEATRKRGIRLIHISTDYVFSGRKDGGYTEDDQPEPLQTYGRTKVEAEEYCVGSDNGGDVLVVRLPLLFGVAHVLPKVTFPEQVVQHLRAGKEVPADTVAIRQPTYTADIAPIIARLAAIDATGIVHVAGQQGITRYDWALEIAAKAGLDPSPIRPTEPKADSNRPRRSFLRDQRLADLGIPSPRPASAATAAFLHDAKLL